MERYFTPLPCGIASVLFVAFLAGCSSSSTSGATGGKEAAGGDASTGGSPRGSGGDTANGGAASTASATVTGGATAATTGDTGGGSGGVVAGGTVAQAGATAAGGASGMAGTTSAGGTSSTAGNTMMGKPDAGADAAKDVASPDAPGAGGVDAGATVEAGRPVIDGGTGPSSFHCVNWADNRDNFVDGHLLMSGIVSDTDTYAGVTTKANLVLDAFVDLLKVNSFRMPINEPTALDPWWNSYKASIDAGIARGMKVIIGFWAKDKGIGKPVDNTRWYAMWKVVIDAYVNNPLVYYDIHNEPHGFTPPQWVVQVNGWLAQFPNVPRPQIIVAGSGWDDNVGSVASNWPDLMMEVHNYAYNGPTTTAGWKTNLLNRLGNAVSRTIVGEWAGQVVEDYTTGIEGFADKSFIVGTANTILENKMGGCWWAGAFAMSAGTSGTTLLVQKGTGDSMTFTVKDPVTLTYFQHSWGLN